MKISNVLSLLMSIPLMCGPGYGHSAQAGEADVVAVAVTKAGGQEYRFDVTVLHDDEGWDHYANRWEVLDAEGNILATRVLAHPHVNEQPFERSLGNVAIPADITSVTIRAHDSVHEHGGVEVTIQLPD